MARHAEIIMRFTLTLNDTKPTYRALSSWADRLFRITARRISWLESKQLTVRTWHD